ncbi:MAG: acyl-[acyl-carrier-protein] thioesterase [Candidatus Avoscillospira sp.]
MAVFEFPTRVAYTDIDGQMALTLRGAMTMMQEAAIVHAAQRGYSIYDIPRTHVIWMLVQWRVRMVGRAMWNDDLVVETWPRSMARVTSDRDFLLRDVQGRTVAVGQSTWILVNTDTGRATRITPEIEAAFDLTDRDVFDTPLAELPEGPGETTFRGAVQHRDLDTNRHMNNLVYLDYALQALPEDLRDRSFPELGIRYSRQMRLGDEIQCVFHRGEGCHRVDLCGGGTVHAAVTFVE